MKNKKCPVCQETKSLDHYSKYFSNERNKYRYSSYCTPCSNEKSKGRNKKYYQKNREKKLQYVKEYRKQNLYKVRKMSATFGKKYCEELQDCYVAELAANSLKCSTKEIHDNPELLQAYRNNLKLKRQIRNYGKE